MSGDENVWLGNEGHFTRKDEYRICISYKWNVQIAKIGSNEVFQLLILTSNTRMLP